MALTLKFATEADIPALLQLRLTVDADQARRFGNDRWSMTISEQRRRSRVGRQLMDRAKVVATEWPVDAIRLDAYDGPSGGGPFYARCGFTEVGRKVYRGVPLVYFEFVLRD